MRSCCNIAITLGRNRFAALRDLSYRVVKVWALRNECDELSRKYAAGKRRARR
jgi:hypothetical protein